MGHPTNLCEEVDEAVVEVLASQMRVAGSGLDLKYALLNGQQRHLPA